ncbi:HAMP domain-containing sensor histidine kinase [Alloacidobacterium sp.]|uniref:sensor histidine kinase n=1 Tax=Alloacidobacterium sp. TaxID=2951999 RepID=UPI002D288C83|nr:HAMP domain-containing sensor histidine kinase [Alloacidobacterium sp.]HYK37022.1 HAMP domain-containing sensor histidine kinase [Alloacidobacterium sp.]
MPPALVKRRPRPSARDAFFAGKFIASRREKEPLDAIAHDARNVVTALELCCDLLAEPGVLSEEHRQFADELRAVASAGSGLVEQLTALRISGRAARTARSLPVDDLAEEVRRLKRPLAALAGPKVDLDMECLSCFGRVHLSQEGLTRILINLTRNAAEAMQQGGRIRITVQQGGGGSFLDGEHWPLRTVLICVQDSGPGIPTEQLEHVFDAGFSTKGAGNANRGLGLSIVRRLVEAAGGTVRAVPALGGARFEAELPLIDFAQTNCGFPADFPGKANLKC